MSSYAATTIATTTLVDLAQSRQSKTPKQVCVELGEQCERLRIDSMDVYGDYTLDAGSSWLRRFESEISSFFGCADAIFVPSGVMAQCMALKINEESRSLTSNSSGGGDGGGGSTTLSRGDAFVCHYSSHLLIHEQDSYEKLLNMKALVVGRKMEVSNEKENGSSSNNSVHKNCDIQPPMLSDQIIQQIEAYNTSFSLSPPNNKVSTVILECPHREIGGKCTPLKDLEVLSKYCRKEGIKLHMDGARFWEAISYYADEMEPTTSSSSSSISTAAPASSSSNNNSIVWKNQSRSAAVYVASLFDSIYVSFYKGIAANLCGSILLSHDAAFIASSRLWLRRFGGNLYSNMPSTVSCYSGFTDFASNEIDIFRARRDKLRLIVTSIGDAIRTITTSTTAASPCNKDSSDSISDSSSSIGSSSSSSNSSGSGSSSSSIIRFDPEVPHTSIIHVYIRGKESDIITANNRLKADHVITDSQGQSFRFAIFTRLRPVRTSNPDNLSESYFELNLGAMNGSYTVEQWTLAYSKFVEILLSM